MLQRATHAWMVYDVLIADIGMVKKYRAQFDRVIRSDGISQDEQTQAEAGPTGVDARSARLGGNKP